MSLRDARCRPANVVSSYLHGSVAGLHGSFTFPSLSLPFFLSFPPSFISSCLRSGVRFLIKATARPHHLCDGLFFHRDTNIAIPPTASIDSTENTHICHVSGTLWPTADSGILGGRWRRLPCAQCCVVTHNPHQARRGRCSFQTWCAEGP